MQIYRIGNCTVSDLLYGHGIRIIIFTERPGNTVRRLRGSFKSKFKNPSTEVIDPSHNLSAFSDQFNPGAFCFSRSRICFNTCSMLSLCRDFSSHRHVIHGQGNKRSAGAHHISGAGRVSKLFNGKRVFRKIVPGKIYRYIVKQGITGYVVTEVILGKTGNNCTGIKKSKP